MLVIIQTFVLIRNYFTLEVNYEIKQSVEVLLLECHYISFMVLNHNRLTLHCLFILLFLIDNFLEYFKSSL